MIIYIKGKHNTVADAISWLDFYLKLLLFEEGALQLDDTCKMLVLDLTTSTRHQQQQKYNGHKPCIRKPQKQKGDLSQNSQ